MTAAHPSLGTPKSFIPAGKHMLLRRETPSLQASLKRWSNTRAIGAFAHETCRSKEILRQWSPSNHRPYQQTAVPGYALLLPMETSGLIFTKGSRRVHEYLTQNMGQATHQGTSQESQGWWGLGPPLELLKQKTGSPRGSSSGAERMYEGSCGSKCKWKARGRVLGVTGRNLPPEFSQTPAV